MNNPYGIKRNETHIFKPESDLKLLDNTYKKRADMILSQMQKDTEDKIALRKKTMAIDNERSQVYCELIQDIVEDEKLEIQEKKGAKAEHQKYLRETYAKQVEEKNGREEKKKSWNVEQNQAERHMLMKQELVRMQDKNN